MLLVELATFGTRTGQSLETPCYPEFDCPVSLRYLLFSILPATRQAIDAESQRDAVPSGRGQRDSVHFIERSA